MAVYKVSMWPYYGHENDGLDAINWQGYFLEADNPREALDKFNALFSPAAGSEIHIWENRSLKLCDI